MLDYYEEASDPDIVTLRHQDGTFAAVFSASGATTEGIVEAAKKDYRELIRAHTNLLAQQSTSTSSNLQRG